MATSTTEQIKNRANSAAEQVKDKANSMLPNDHSEGRFTKKIENQTAKLPSDVFLIAAISSILGALALKTAGRDKDAQFVGQWVPTMLLFGVYNKIVKLLGND